MWRRIALTLLLALFVATVYARGPHPVASSADLNHTTTGAKMNAHRHPLPPIVMEKVRKRVMERMGKGFDLNIPRKHPRARMLRSKATQLRQRIQRLNLVLQRIHESLRRTFLRYHRVYREWAQYRRMYLQGELNDEEYLQKTKTFLETLIETTINRLEAFKEANIADENVDQVIGELQDLNREIAEVNDLNTLRTIYKEDARPLLLESTKLIRQYYGSVSLMVFTGVLVKTEIGVDRTLAVLQRIGVDVNTDENIQNLLNRIETLKTEINDLKTKYISGEITSRELLIQLKKIRDEVQRTLMELRAQIRYHIKERMKARALHRNVIRHRPERNEMRGGMR